MCSCDTTTELKCSYTLLQNRSNTKSTHLLIKALWTNRVLFKTRLDVHYSGLGAIYNTTTMQMYRKSIKVNLVEEDEQLGGQNADECEEALHHDG